MTIGNNTSYIVTMIEKWIKPNPKIKELAKMDPFEEEPTWGSQQVKPDKRKNEN